MSWYIKKNDDVLAHAGTKGMKWGVRKYQNEDGTLTAAGKERYRNMVPSSAKKGMDDAAKRAHIEELNSRARDALGFDPLDKNGIMTKEMQETYLNAFRLPDNIKRFSDPQELNRLYKNMKEQAGEENARILMNLFNKAKKEEERLRKTMPVSAYNARIKAIRAKTPAGL